VSLGIYPQNPHGLEERVVFFRKIQFEIKKTIDSKFKKIWYFLPKGEKAAVKLSKAGVPSLKPPARAVPDSIRFYVLRKVDKYAFMSFIRELSAA